jgi:transcriptional regulator with XRE-family HTH domain
MSDEAIGSAPPDFDPARAQRLFGWRMAELRMARHWSQQEVADKIGVSHSTVSRYEDGLTNPSVPTLIRLREIFGTTLDYLLAGIRGDGQAPGMPPR